MANTFELISSVTVGAGGAASIDFTSIPATYTDLVLELSGRSTASGTYNGVALTLNGSTSGFSGKELYGTGSAAGAGNPGTANNIGYVDGSSATASTFANCSWYIPNYAGSNYKSMSGDGVVENNATSALAWLTATLWSNSAAITSISIATTTAFAQYSTAYLYGVKNA